MGGFVSRVVFGATLSAARNHRCSRLRKCVFWDGMEDISAERLASWARRKHSSTRLVDTTQALPVASSTKVPMCRTRGLVGSKFPTDFADAPGEVCKLGALPNRRERFFGLGFLGKFVSSSAGKRGTSDLRLAD